MIHVSNKSLVHVALPKVKALKLPENTTVHGKLAASLALWHSNPEQQAYKPWQDVWPSPADFKATIPFFYPRKLQDLLPEAALPLLNKQQKKLEKDWTELQTHIPSVKQDLFTYTWLIVNTRTFYWEYPDLSNFNPRLPKRRTKMTADDCYAMCPFMDYFNHSDTGCTPTNDAKGYTFIADKEYKAGEELFISYGQHTNDFLLVEYGFILEKNVNDSLPLDHLLLPLLTSGQVDALKEDGYFGNYTLSSSSPYTCHRTQATLRLIVLDSKRYSTFVGGLDDGIKDQDRLDCYLVKLLTKYSRQIIERIEVIEEISEAATPTRTTRAKAAESDSQLYEGQQKQTLLTRWKQIREFVNTVISKLEK